ncbi:MAG: Gfo/Idh/MocA family oxidoreductase [Candidatus Acidiferrum sp.]
MQPHAAIVGLGFVGRAHLDALRRLGIPVQGVLGSTPDRSKAAAESLHLPRAYNSLDDLAADASVQVVHLCTPNHLHFQEASQLLRAGKHVLCEKPLSLDSHESAALVKLLKETGLVGAVTYNLRYYPLCQEARILIREHVIGQVKLVHGSFLQDWLLFPTDWNWRLEAKLGGELRAVSDIGTHWLDLVTWLTDSKVSALCADLATVLPTRRRPKGRVETFQKAATTDTEEVMIATDDYASVLLHFENEARGVMTVSQVSPGRKARLWFEIDGSEGSLAFDSESPNQLWIGRRQRACEVLPKDPALQTPESRGYAAYPGGHPEGYPDTFVQLFKDVYAYIAASDPRAPRTFPTFETGHEELVLCETISESARKKSWVTVGA